MAKMGLGRGLDSLIPKKVDSNIQTSAEGEKKIIPAAKSENEKSGENIVKLRLSKVEPNKEQSRKTFEEDSLNELAQSIKQFGIIQPIVVCKKDDYYEIIAGERRWRAAKIAGLNEIPVIIKEYQEKERAEVSLIENIQRENLNPIEEAAAYRQLIDEYNLTQESLAERISKSRTAIANTMRLLKLHEDVQQLVIDGKLSNGHARALLGIEEQEKQYEAAQKVIEENLTVRQTEELVKEMTTSEKSAAKPAKKKNKDDYIYKDLEKHLTDALGTKVKISQKEKGGGRIEISYFSDYDLDRIYRQLNNG